MGVQCGMHISVLFDFIHIDRKMQTPCFLLIITCSFSSVAGLAGLGQFSSSTLHCAQVCVQFMDICDNNGTIKASPSYDCSLCKDECGRIGYSYDCEEGVGLCHCVDNLNREYENLQFRDPFHLPVFPVGDCSRCRDECDRMDRAHKCEDGVGMCECVERERETLTFSDPFDACIFPHSEIYSGPIEEHKLDELDQLNAQLEEQYRADRIRAELPIWMRPDRPFGPLFGRFNPHQRFPLRK